ncbi:PTS sugar transporter subunit IIA [bacterium]|nr:PTS sugar transporter subunit IIA [bacterium]
MADKENKVYIIIGHNDQEYLEKLKKIVEVREGVYSIMINKCPAIHSFNLMNFGRFSIREASLKPICRHAIAFVCIDSVTIIADILETASEVYSENNDDGIICSITDNELKKLDNLYSKKSVETQKTFINDECIILDKSFYSKDDLLMFLSKKAFDIGVINNVDSFFASLLKREELQSTGIGHGIAFPHSHHDSVIKDFVMFIRLEKKLDFDAIDGQGVELIFLLGNPINSKNHLPKLAALSRALHDRNKAKIFALSTDKNEIISIIGEI